VHICSSGEAEFAAFVLLRSGAYSTQIFSSSDPAGACPDNTFAVSASWESAAGRTYLITVFPRDAGLDGSFQIFVDSSENRALQEKTPSPTSSPGTGGTSGGSGPRTQ
jgi:hypothetical protein